jgi:tagaturonate reductase
MTLPHLNRQTAGCGPAPQPRILQFGGGNFLRAFLDWMVDLMNERVGFQGSALIVKPTAGGAYKALDRQDGLFHVCLRGVTDGETIDQCRLVQSVHSYVHPYLDFERYLRTAEMPELRLVVSNTTEAGIAYRQEDMLEDRPAPSFPGKLTQWLFHRYRHFEGSPAGGCIVLPCELIEQNGKELRKIVFRHAERWALEDGFLHWLRQHVMFCNTLVDRIVPGYPQQESQEVEERIGFRDELLTVAEPYHLWAIEGGGELLQHFPAPQAGLNVRIVDDLTPYRTLKVRLLNGAHTAMVPVGLLAGLHTVRDVMEDPLAGAFIKKLLYDEIIPILDNPASEARDYAGTVIDRFLNPFVRHQLADIALNSTAKFAARLQPSLEQYHAQKKCLPQRLVFSLAALITFYRGNGAPLRDEPAAIDHFKKAWAKETLFETSRHALSFWDIAPELKPVLAKEVSGYLQRIQNGSVRKVLAALDVQR